MTILLERRVVFGKVLYYPVNSEAQIVTFLTGRKTVLLTDIKKLRALGVEVQLKQEELEV